MSRSPSDRILDEWDDVTRRARRPVRAPLRRGVHAGGSLLGFAPLLAAAIVVAIGIGWLSNREGGVAASLSPSATVAPSAVAVVVPTPSPVGPSPSLVSPSPSPTVRPSATPVVVPTPTPTRTPETDCTAELSAAIVSWEGAAGSRIGTIRLRNDGPTSCPVPVMARPDLVDRFVTLAIGRTPDDDRAIDLEPGGTLTTLVQAANVCVDRVTPPVTVQFDFNPGFSIRADPLTPDDATVPPCNGPGQPASIEMQPFRH